MSDAGFFCRQGADTPRSGRHMHLPADGDFNHLGYHREFRLSHVPGGGCISSHQQARELPFLKSDVISEKIPIGDGKGDLVVRIADHTMALRVQLVKTAGEKHY